MLFRSTPVASWDDWVGYVKRRPGELVDVAVRRDGQRQTFSVTIGTAEEGGRTIGRIGASRTSASAKDFESLKAEQQFGVFEAVPRGIATTWEISALTVKMLVRMVVGEVSLKNMSGPLTIADYAGESAQAGLAAFLSFLAAVSISLGILNLLPIPILDGGQVVYQVAEWLKGSPLSERALAIGQQIGVFMLILLMSFAFYNDISRHIGS